MSGIFDNPFAEETPYYPQDDQDQSESQYQYQQDEDEHQHQYQQNQNQQYDDYGYSNNYQEAGTNNTNGTRQQPTESFRNYEVISTSQSQKNGSGGVKGDLFPAQTRYTEIQVTQPEKINDHTTYKVITKNQSGTCFVQQRRYRDFLWLFDELVAKHPGSIVPPVPEKKMIGRFEADFVEARRHFLEKFLKRLNNHPIFMEQSDFHLFIESPRFDEVSSGRKENKSLIQVFGGVLSDVTSFGKSHHDDTIYEARKEAIFVLDVQLRKLQRKVDLIVRQRKELGNAVANFWNDISSVPQDSNSVFLNLSQLGAVQLKVEEVHQRESSQYVFNFGNTVNEYIRMIESFRSADTTRSIVYKDYRSALDKINKKKDKLDKFMGHVDKGEIVNQTLKEIEEAQKEVDETKKKFDEVDQVLKDDLDRFDYTFKQDFQDSMKSYVQNMVQSQNEISQWWDSYIKDTESGKNNNI